MTLTIDESWLAFVSAVVVLVSLDPEDPVEVEAVPLEGGPSLYSAVLMSDGPLAAGVQTCYWYQTGLLEAQFEL